MHISPAGATLRKLLAEGGVRGMWRGTGPTVVRLSLGAGINFVVLEKLKAAMINVSRAASQVGTGSCQVAQPSTTWRCGCLAAPAQPCALGILSWCLPPQLASYSYVSCASRPSFPCPSS